MSNAISPSEGFPALSPGVRDRANGVLELTLRRSGGRTVVYDCYSHVPLQVLRPVYLDNTGTAYVYLLNPCGGILGGDTCRITVTLESDAHAYLTTPSATKLYAAPGAAAQQRLAFRLDDRAVLTYLPEQTIPFANAALHQRLRIRLGRDAWAFVGEIVAPGRWARGECFAYREYCSEVRVEATPGRVLLLERTRLQPQRQCLSGLGLLEGYLYLGTFYALGTGASLPETLVEQLHTLLAGQPQLIGSATLLETGGLAVRWLGMEHGSMRHAMNAVWDVLRRHVLGWPAVPCRP
jgi:urease accessory protein